MATGSVLLSCDRMEECLRRFWEACKKKKKNENKWVVAQISELVSVDGYWDKKIVFVCYLCNI